MAETGGKDMRERAKDMAREILKEHNPVYVDEKQRKEVWKIAMSAQKQIDARVK
jgi:trimethylamine:corrinoid methyltransferase-like protein